jgi:hypothetical protein
MEHPVLPEWHKLWGSSLYNFPHSPMIQSHLSTNILFIIQIKAKQPILNDKKLQ